MSDCERYRRDPDALAAHADSCEACRELVIELDRVEDAVFGAVEPKPEFRDRVASRLPLAPWEGASYQSWGLVIAVLAMLVVLVAGAFLAVGVSPLRAARAFGSTMLPLVSPFELARAFSAVVASAPASFHVAVGIGFIVVNLILFLLLRRRPKGYDA